MGTILITHTIDKSILYTTNREGINRLVCCIPTSHLLSALISLSSQYQFLESGIIQVAEDDYTLKYSKQHYDAETTRLISEIHERIAILQKKGMSLRTLREALLQYQTPSRLTITSDLRILLSDYNNLEVPLTPLCKALYLLYLRHPEGIAFKELINHHDELLSLYQQTAPTINPARHHSHVERLTNPLDNSLNEKISLIRHSFADLLDDNLLPFYIIQGEKSERRKIHLPSDLITFC